MVKPEAFIARENGTLLQPAVKCRGSEYLRIIYGAEYLESDHLRRLKKRGLNRKRNLALKEFSLGLEALDRFVRRDPLYRVHECMFGVLAMESEPVDPRLQKKHRSISEKWDAACVFNWNFFAESGFCRNSCTAVYNSCRMLRRNAHSRDDIGCRGRPIRYISDEADHAD